MVNPVDVFPLTGVGTWQRSIGKVDNRILAKMALWVVVKRTGFYNILLPPPPWDRTGKLPIFSPCVYWTKIYTQRLTCPTHIRPEAGCSVHFREVGHTTHIQSSRSNVSNKLLRKLKSIIFHNFLVLARKFALEL